MMSERLPRHNPRMGPKLDSQLEKNSVPSLASIQHRKASYFFLVTFFQLRKNSYRDSVPQLRPGEQLIDEENFIDRTQLGYHRGADREYIYQTQTAARRNSVFPEPKTRYIILQEWVPLSQEGKANHSWLTSLFLCICICTIEQEYAMSFSSPFTNRSRQSQRPVSWTLVLEYRDLGC